MRKLFFMLVVLCTVFSSFAQDVIVKKNGETVVCRIIKNNSSEVIYKKWDDLNGSNYILNRTDITYINYENGKRENLSSSNLNEFAPNNQSNGSQLLNDIALMQIDSDYHQYNIKAKKLKSIGWIGGSALLIGSGIFCYLATQESDFFGHTYGEISVILAGTSIAWTTGFLISANRLQKKYKSLVINTSLLQNKFTFNNGSTLICSTDLLKDNQQKSHVLGIGLRYKF